jgi:hypothetical protein
MTTWSYFAWLFRQAADGLLYMWPVTAALVCPLAIGLFRYLQRSSRIPGGWLLHVTPLLVPVAILVVGTVYACENCSPSSLGQGVHHVWAGYVIDTLLLVQLAAAVWLIKAAKGARFVASALQVMNLWWTFWASFLAGMSISGDWL